jgi:hypothetical protein
MQAARKSHVVPVSSQSLSILIQRRFMFWQAGAQAVLKRPVTGHFQPYTLTCVNQSGKKRVIALAEREPRRAIDFRLMKSRRLK